MKLIELTMPVAIHDLSMFQIGTNQPLINHGKMQHYASHVLGDQIISLCEKSVDTKSLGIIVSGYVLQQLEQEHPEALGKLQSFVKDNAVHVYGVPFYGSSFSVMGVGECKEQLDLEVDAIQSYFGKSLDGLYVGEQHVPSEIKRLLGEFSLPVIGKSSDYHSLSEISSTELNDHMLSDGIFSTLLASQASQHELSGHVAAELSALYPHVASSGDDELLLNLRLLSQEQNLQNLNSEVHVDAYDTYMNTMNVLNDVSHQLRSVSMAERGEFLTDVTIDDSPSSLLEVRE